MYNSRQLAQKYMRYWLHAENAKGHGVHSPFVFDFIKFVKNARVANDVVEPIEARRNELLKNNSIIAVEDFGAGSAVIKTNQRMVRKIADSSLKPKRFAQLLHRIALHYKPATIIELGTSFGITTSYLATGNPDANIITLEGSRAIADIAEETFQRINLRNIRLVRGSFEHTLQNTLKDISYVDLAFVDGHHQREPTLSYFEQLLAKAHPGSIFIFDDIHWSEGMEQAWQQIIGHESVTLSIDLFFIGIVFFRDDFKIKQHFSLRF